MSMMSVMILFTYCGCVYSVFTGSSCFLSRSKYDIAPLRKKDEQPNNPKTGVTQKLLLIVS